MCRIMGMCLRLHARDGLGCDKLPAHMALKQSHRGLSSGFTPVLFHPPRLGHYDSGIRSPQTPLSHPRLTPSSSFPLAASAIRAPHPLSLNHGVSHSPLPPGDITAHSLLRLWMHGCSSDHGS